MYLLQNIGMILEADTLLQDLVHLLQQVLDLVNVLLLLQELQVFNLDLITMLQEQVKENSLIQEFHCLNQLQFI